MNRRTWLLGSLLTVSLLVSGVALADELTADQLAAKVVRGNGFTWEGADTRMRMVLIESGGQRSERALEVLGRRHDGKLETVARFTSPSDIAGTKFLMVEKSG